MCDCRALMTCGRAQTYMELVLFWYFVLSVFKEMLVVVLSYSRKQAESYIIKCCVDQCLRRSRVRFGLLEFNVSLLQ